MVMHGKSKMSFQELCEFLDMFIKSEPPEGWHCQNVLNFKGEADRTNEFYGMLSAIICGYRDEGQPSLYRLSYYLTELTRKIERYERELAQVDSDFKKYTEVEVARILSGGKHPTASYCGIYFYDCPNCGKRYHLEDILKDNVVKPYSMKNLKQESEVKVKYPKVKI